MTLPAPVRPKSLLEELEKVEKEAEPDTKADRDHDLNLESSSGSESASDLDLDNGAKGTASSSSGSQSDSKVLTPQESFMKAMTTWVKGLTKCEKKDLTRLKVNRRAALEASRLNLPTSKFPENWFQRLRSEANMVCYIKKSSYERKKELEEDKKKSMEGNPEESEASAKPKIVDLTNVPPPGWWLQLYHKGLAPPRRENTFFDGQQLTIYWDYNSKNWVDYDPQTKTVQQSTKTTVMLPTDSDGVMSNYKKCLEEEREKDVKVAKARGMYYDKLLLERHLEMEKKKSEEEQKSTPKDFEGGKASDSDSDFG